MWGHKYEPDSLPACRVMTTPLRFDEGVLRWPLCGKQQRFTEQGTFELGFKGSELPRERVVLRRECSEVTVESVWGLVEKAGEGNRGVESHSKEIRLF